MARKRAYVVNVPADVRLTVAASSPEEAVELARKTVSSFVAKDVLGCLNLGEKFLGAWAYFPEDYRDEIEIIESEE